MKTISLKKKVAALAVASLGLGLLSVAPASAANPPADATPSVVSSTLVTTVGTPVSTVVKVVAGAMAADQGTFDMTPSIVSSPGDSGMTITAVDDTGAQGNGITTSGTFGLTLAGSEAPYSSYDTLTNGVITITDPATASVQVTATTSATGIGTFTIVPDKAGVYVMRITAESGQTTDRTVDITVYAGYSVDGAKPNTSFMTQGVSTTNSNQATTGGLGTVRVTNFEDNSADTRYYATVSGGTLAAVGVSNDIDKDASNTAGFNFTNGTNLAGGIDFFTDSAADVSDYVDFTVTSATAGNVTISVVKYDASTGIATKISTPVVVFTTALSLDPTVSTSKIYIGTAQNSEATAASTAPTTVAMAAGTDAAGVTVIVNDGYGNPVSGADVLTTVSGPGLICGAQGANGSCTPAARVALSTTAAAGKVYVNLDADGTAGVSTLTFTVGTTVLGTKSVTFYGSAAKYTATTQLNATANGTATTDAVVVCAVDAAGIAVPGSTIYAFSGDATAASVETSDATEATAIATSGTIPTSFVATTPVGCVGFDVTGVSATTKSSVEITFGNAATLALSTVTTKATVNLGAVQAASVALSTDKASYAPGEKMTITLTWKDALGRGIGAGVGTGTLAAALTSSASLTGDALFAANNTSKLGVTSITAYAPLQGGKLTLTGKTGTDATYLATAIRGIELSASVNVVDANQTSIQSQISSLIAAIAKLQKAINKIQKRLNR